MNAATFVTGGSRVIGGRLVTRLVGEGPPLRAGPIRRLRRGINDLAPRGPVTLQLGYEELGVEGGDQVL